jgi:hypothetical protein
LTTINEKWLCSLLVIIVLCSKLKWATTSFRLALVVQQYSSIVTQISSSFLVSASSLLNNDAPLPMRVNPCEAPLSMLTWPPTRLDVSSPPALPLSATPCRIEDTVAELGSHNIFGTHHAQFSVARLYCFHGSACI